MSIIFSSYLSLKFKSESNEIAYQKYKKNNLNKLAIYLNLLMFIVSIGNTVMLRFLFNANKEIYEFPHGELITLAYVELSLRFLTTITLFFCRGSKLFNYLQIFNFYMLSISFFSVRFMIYSLGIDQEGNFKMFVTTFEIMLRIFCFKAGVVDFLSGLLMNALTSVTLFPLYFYLHEWKTDGFIYGYVCFLLSFSIQSYIFEYYKKTSLFYYLNMQRKMDWYQSIFMNMNSGFIHISNSKINFLNKNLTEILEKSKVIVGLKEIRTEYEEKIKINKEEKFNFNALNINHHSIDEFYIRNSKVILDLLLSDIRKDQELDNYMKTIGKASSDTNANNLNNNINSNFNFISKDSDFFFNEFRREYNILQNDFKFVGLKTVTIYNKDGKEEDLTFEVFCRYYLDVNSHTYTDDYEVLFNDITRTLIMEEKKSEMKFKSLFLSKVAHELKNPLICIIELVNQLSDSLKCMRECRASSTDMNNLISNPCREKYFAPVDAEFSENLHLINSISNYLIILIRDLDYFSRKEIIKKDEPEQLDECSLDDVLLFVKEITNSLLKKVNKCNVSIEVLKDIDVPEKVWTEEVRLKQVIINLMSNAIKFTPQGKITLRAVKEKVDGADYVTFTVEDSGTGIDIKKQKTLFDPYLNFSKSDKANNPFGSGLGMSIIYDLTSALGKTIQFTSELGKGSKFWFSIPCVSKKSNAENFCEVEISKRLSRRNSIMNSLNTLKNTSNLALSNIVIENSSYQDSFIPVQAPNKNYNIDIGDFNACRLIMPVNIDSIVEEEIDFSRSTIQLEHFPFCTPLKLLNNNTSNNLFSGEKKHSNTQNSYKILINDDDCFKYNTNTYFNDKFVRSNAHTKTCPGEKLPPVSEKDDYLSKYSSSRKQTRKQSKVVSSTEITNGVNFNIFDSVDKLFLNLKSEDNSSDYNVIIVDDEKLSRMSTRRIIRSLSESLKKRVNILEAEDGIECTYLVYNCVKKGIKVSFILSDQTMSYLNGSLAASVLKDMSSFSGFKEIPYYIITAYEDEKTLKKLKSSSVNDVLCKPLTKKAAQKIFNKLEII